MTDKMDRRTMMGTTAGVLCAAMASGPSAGHETVQGKNPAAFETLVTKHRIVNVDGLDIFYREAGPPDAPAILLLHGFPTSSHMFRHLIPGLADRYRVVAPDYPAFGHSSFPPPGNFPYSFAAFASVIAKFTDAVGLERYVVYIQDYGAPVGLRLALERPNAIAALITQNGNAYEEGLSSLWDPLRAYWSDPSPKNRNILQSWLGEEGTRLQYTAGLRNEQIERLAPDSWILDWERLRRPGNAEVQIALFGDYRSNVELYPRFQAFLNARRPPTLVLWGMNDPFFTIAGAKAFLRDVPDAELDLVDGSHFLLETHGPYATHRIRQFLARTHRQ